MPLSIRAEQKSGYLHVTVTGEHTRENLVAYVEAVRAVCVERKCRAVLIEENLEGPDLGFAVTYDVVAGCCDRVRTALGTIAFVDVNPEHSRDESTFVETVAVNRSLRLRSFPSVAEAARWLEEVVGP